MAYDAKLKARAKTDSIGIYASLTPDTKDIGAKDIDKAHRKLGYVCIGYHYVIRRNGTVEEGREEHQAGAFFTPSPETSVGICLVGTAKATPEQLKSLKQLLIDLFIAYPKAKVQSHTALVAQLDN